MNDIKKSNKSVILKKQHSASGPLEDFINKCLQFSLSCFLFLFFCYLYFFHSFLKFRFSDFLVFSFLFLLLSHLSFVFLWLLFPGKKTSCAAKSPLIQVFKEIQLKMNPRKNTFCQILDAQNKKLSP